MRIVFCADPMNPREPDPAYEQEVSAAQALGIEYTLLSFEALVYDGNPAKAVSRVAEQHDPTPALYRGWMLTPEQYSQLYDSLAARGVYLLNTPAQYKHCHYLPESYPLIEPYTARSVWLETGSEVSFDRVMEILKPFDSSPLVLKDFVKSRKHEWSEACFIPSAANRQDVERVVRRFVELQDGEINGGLVFREFVRFEPLTTHSLSGMPLTKEYRIFFLDGNPIYWTQYWEEGDYRGVEPPVDMFLAVAAQIKSRFYTMDIGKQLNGEWMIVELGDAQVAGLPDKADVTAFYATLHDRWPEK